MSSRWPVTLSWSSAITRPESSVPWQQVSDPSLADAVDYSVSFKYIFFLNEDKPILLKMPGNVIILTLELRMRHFLEVMWEEYESESRRKSLA